MDKGLRIVVLACIGMIVFFAAYQLSEAMMQDGNEGSTVINIVLNGDSVSVSSSHPVVVDGSRITIKSAGTYNIEGTLTDGQIVVSTKDEDPVNLILNNVNINCSTSAPIFISDAEEAIIYLGEGTENFVSDAPSYAFANPGEDEPNAAVFSKSNLTILGAGSLKVVGNYNDGITSKDKLIIENGTILVNSIDDGIRGRDCLVVKSCSLTLNVGGDGLKSDNAENVTLGYVSIVDGVIDIRSGGDAIQAEREVLIANGSFRLSSAEDAIQAESNVVINDGSFSLTSGGDAIQAGREVLISGGSFSLTSHGGSGGVVGSDVSAKGIKGGVGVTIGGGVFQVDSADDAVHSDGRVTVNGGSLVLSSGDDAIHADSSITINNGEIEIKKSFEGIEAPVVTINNGIIHIESNDDGINLGINTIGEHEPFASTYTGDYYLYINGGYISIKSLGDGIDSNGAVVMTNGVVLVESPWSIWHSAFDHVAFNITGGFLIVVGSSNWEQTPGDLSTQHSVMLNFQSANQAGTLIHVQSSDGDEAFTFKPTRLYKSVVFSMSSVFMGSSYDVYLGGTHTGTVKDGLYSGGTYTPGTKYTSFIISSTVTVIGP